MRIRIVSLPDGEAPEDIRRAWIGLTLPLMAGDNAPRVIKSVGGVLTMPKTKMGEWWRIITGRTVRKTGYCVPATRSIQILEDTNPEAAAWWKKNVPLVNDKQEAFLFNVEACEEVE